MELFFYLIIVVVGFLFVVFLISSLIGVPCMPTHLKQAKKMIALANLKPGMRVIDLGSGNGRLLFLAAKTGANAVGYELNPFLVYYTKLAIFFARVSDLVSVRLQSIYTADLKDADVVFAFLMPGPMEKLGPKLFSELKPGAMIYSYTFPIPGHEPVQKEQGIRVYRV
ncbi:MAG: 50S ribosomal protein L11 methyltransferase [Patescibacteria group bacterium]|jgi:SAM-dependent methyltransferase